MPSGGSAGVEAFAVSAPFEPPRDFVVVEQSPTLNLVRGQLTVSCKAVDLLGLAAQDRCELVGGEEGRQGAHLSEIGMIAKMRQVLDMPLKRREPGGR